jgi:UDP-glucose 4-epimerase
MTKAEILESYRGRSVLITGGLGFIGSNLAHRLAEPGDVQVAIIDALLPEQGGNPYNIQSIRDRVELHQVNLSDDWAINHLVAGVDYIFNLAGSVSHVDSMQHPQRDLQLNCEAQLALLEACRHFNPHVKIVFTSTRQVYGEAVYLPLDEQHRTAPIDVNGVNKLAAEYYHLLYHRVYGTRTVCLRLTNTYGPRQLLTHDRQGVIPWLIRQALDGGVLELFGDGKQKRDLTFVDDVVEALLMAGVSEAAEGEVFNVGGGKPLTLSEVAAELISITGSGSVRCSPFPLERQLIDIGNAYLTHQKIEKTLGWRARTSLREGLKRTVDFYREHGEHYLPANAGVKG